MLVSVIIFLMPPKWPVTFSVWQQLHLPSPSIGMTRAYRHVLHGEFAAAWRQNKLIFAVIGAGGAIIAKDVSTLMQHHRLQKTSGDRTKRLTV